MFLIIARPNEFPLLGLGFVIGRGRREGHCAGAGAGARLMTRGRRAGGATGWRTRSGMLQLEIQDFNIKENEL